MLTNHPLNGTYAGWMQDCRQSFWPVDAYRLEPTMPGVETLAHLTNYLGHDFGPCMTAYENELGGRVVVMGYYPWKLIHNMCKSSQLKAVCTWLSRDTQRVTAESFARVMVWARQGTRGQIAIVLCNATLDAQETLSIRVRTAATCFELVDMDGNVSGVTGELCTGHDGEVRLVLHNLAPWSLYLLRVAQLPNRAETMFESIPYPGAVFAGRSRNDEINEGSTNSRVWRTRHPHLRRRAAA